MRLSKRLETMLALAPECGTAADIGSDHGLLPIAMIKAGKAKKAVASDLSALSLGKARRNIEEYDCAGQVELRVGDGLSVLSPGEAGLVILSGMGGELIARILKEGIGRIGDARLLISANNQDAQVRDTLNQNGFRITAEELVSENRRYYQILLAERGEKEEFSPLELEFGKLNIANRHPLLSKVVEKRVKDAGKMKKTAARADNERARAAFAEAERRLEAYGRLLTWLSQ